MSSYGASAAGVLRPVLAIAFAASKDGPIRHLEASMRRRPVTEGLVFIPSGTRHAADDV